MLGDEAAKVSTQFASLIAVLTYHFLRSANCSKSPTELGPAMDIQESFVSDHFT